MKLSPKKLLAGLTVAGALFAIACLTPQTFKVGEIKVTTIEQANAGGTQFTGNPSGSCYRLDAWYNGFNGTCSFPRGSNSVWYTNLRSVTWGQGIGNIPADITFYNPVKGRNVGTCRLGRNLQFVGSWTCYNPSPYEPTVIQVKPLNNRSRTFFYISPS